MSGGHTDLERLEWKGMCVCKVPVGIELWNSQGMACKLVINWGDILLLSKSTSDKKSRGRAVRQGRVESERASVIFLYTPIRTDLGGKDETYPNEVTFLIKRRKKNNTKNRPRISHAVTTSKRHSLPHGLSCRITQCLVWRARLGYQDRSRKWPSPARLAWPACWLGFFMKCSYFISSAVDNWNSVLFHHHFF